MDRRDEIDDLLNGMALLQRYNAQRGTIPLQHIIEENISFLERLKDEIDMEIKAGNDQEQFKIEELTSYLCSDDDRDTLKNWYYHPPKGDQVLRYKKINELTKAAAEFISQHCPPCRERSLAITTLQQARMWANAAIAVHE